MQCRRINLALAVFGTTLVSTIGIGTSPATAAPLVISVTTPADGIYDDGLTTLREAVEIANAASGPSEIRLLPGAKHNLSGCSAARGDLDITTDHDVTIVGGGATIVQLCEDRHIDHQPPGGTARLLITGTTLTGAHGVTSEGGSIRTTGALALDQTTIADTSDGIAAVVALGDAPITLDLTTITGTRRGAGLASFGEASVRVTDSTITHNLTGYRGDGAARSPPGCRRPGTCSSSSRPSPPTARWARRCRPGRSPTAPPCATRRRSPRSAVPCRCSAPSR
ncbi:MAG: hypothetical protein R2690_08175 [Acidimicrobiales bacterium]